MPLTRPVDKPPFTLPGLRAEGMSTLNGFEPGSTVSIRRRPRLDRFAVSDARSGFWRTRLFRAFAGVPVSLTFH